MKKFFIFGLAVIFCLAFTPAAMAKITFSGQLTTDITYRDTSSESAAGGVQQGAANLDNGRELLEINIPQYANQFHVRYHSDDGKLFGHIEMRSGGGDNAKATIWEKAYADYTLNDMFHIRVGRQPHTFGTAIPFMWVGASSGTHLLFLGMGTSVGGGAAMDAIKGYIRFNDMVRMEISLHDPKNDDSAGDLIGTFGTSNATGGNPTEENVIPHLEMSLPVTIGNFSMEPGFGYYPQNYDQTEAGDDDDMTAWGAYLPVRMGFGPLTIGAMIGYNENVSAPGPASTTYLFGGAFGGPVAYDADADGDNDKIADTENVFGFVYLMYNFGPANLTLAFGVDTSENDGDPTVATDSIDVTRYAYGANLNIPITKGFSVMPEITYYDFDDSAENGTVVANPTTIDYGSDLLIGVQFVLRF